MKSDPARAGLEARVASLETLVTDQEDMIAILTRDVEGSRCRCPPQLPSISEEVEAFVASSASSEGREVPIEAVGVGSLVTSSDQEGGSNGLGQVPDAAWEEGEVEYLIGRGEEIALEEAAIAAYIDRMEGPPSAEWSPSPSLPLGSGKSRDVNF